jgi:hypothetical protein
MVEVEVKEVEYCSDKVEVVEIVVQAEGRPLKPPDVDAW